MYDLKNTTDQPINLVPGPSIEAGGSAHVSRATLLKLEKEPYNARVISDGKIEVTRSDISDTSPTAEDEGAPSFTADFIEGATKSELIVAIKNTVEAYGLDAIDTSGMKRGDLQEIATGLLESLDGKETA